jgi:hypothetical protein
MGRYTFPAFNTATTPRYVVLWNLQWHVIACQRLAGRGPLRLNDDDYGRGGAATGYGNGIPANWK